MKKYINLNRIRWYKNSFRNIEKSKFTQNLRSHTYKHETNIPLVAINILQNPDNFIENKSTESYIIKSI